MMAVVVAAALALMVMYSTDRARRCWPIVLLSVWVLAWFVRNWRKEFVFLMGLRDEDLPGRHDKLIWAACCSSFAPIGVWFFRSYRLAHWPRAQVVDRPRVRARSRWGSDADAAGMGRVGASDGG